MCPCSREPSPDNEGALHSSFCQLIEEQSSLVAGAIEMELQERGRGTARNCSSVGWGQSCTPWLSPHILPLLPRAFGSPAPPAPHGHYWAGA